MQLEAALETARVGHGQFVLVSGEAGIGKTALVDRFVQTNGDSTRVLRGYCDPLLTPSALGPLLDITRDLGSDLSMDIDGDRRASAIFARFLAILTELSKPALLVVEDIHWADEATIDLLKYLGRRLDGARVLMIATFRDDEVRRHDGLRFLLGDLATTRNVERLELARLSRDAVSSLAGGRVADVDGLFRSTGGNPFFVTEVVANPAAEVPATVRDAVLGRVARLGPEGRRLLDRAAVVGARVDYELLEAVAGPDGTGLSECLAMGILQDLGHCLAFRHELARNAVLEAVDPLRRRALSREVLAAAIQAGFADKGLTARLAHYAESAGSAPDVIRYGTAAGQTASSLGAHKEAAAHFRAVLRFSEGQGSAERARISAAYARECAVLDWLPEAIEAYRMAVELWGDCGDRTRQGEALSLLAWPLVRHGANAEADEIAQQAIALLEPLGPSRELANAYRTHAHLRMLDRDCGRAVEIGGKAMSMAADLDDMATLAGAEMVVGAAKLVTDDREGRAHLDRCIEIAQAGRLHEVVALARMNIGTSYGEQYHLAEAEDELIDGIDIAREHDLDHSGHYMASWLALTHMFQGQWDKTAALCDDLLAQPNLAAISRIMALVALGRIRVRRGDPGAPEALDEALHLAKRTSTLQRLAPVHAARAELAWFAGDPKQAAAEARQVFELAERRRHAWHTGEMLFWLKRAGETVPDIDWIAPPYARQIAGDWEHAAALWRQRGCPFEEARALADGTEAARLRALEIFDGLGAAPAAAALRREMREAGARRIPRGPRSSTRLNPFGLTNREMTILGHLVDGLTNAEIGNALFISPKTVDHHVSSILSKLGTPSRRDAAELALREGMAPQNGDA
ncbi:AAA family ATPase [Rhodobacterales bacterium HKCCE3408]|nr:AAA family ATPase [Rhodobacterales bacterium HKCCE3408]